jgi:hypothetical protein
MGLDETGSIEAKGLVKGLVLTSPFQFTYSFQQHYGPGVDSACNRDEYQEYS